jgi:hypothetical protein
VVCDRGGFATTAGHGEALLDPSGLLLALAEHVGARPGDQIRITVERTTVTSCDALLAEAAGRVSPHNTWFETLRDPRARAHSAETLRRLWRHEAHTGLFPKDLMERIGVAVRELDEIDCAAAAQKGTP